MSRRLLICIGLASTLAACAQSAALRQPLPAQSESENSEVLGSDDQPARRKAKKRTVKLQRPAAPKLATTSPTAPPAAATTAAPATTASVGTTAAPARSPDELATSVPSAHTALAASEGDRAIEALWRRLDNSARKASRSICNGC